ncbi:MAG: toll/interleukin-1 receptor domain-containing protein [Frankiaceae bacterium]
MSDQKDFFISYNRADESWAVWIAWQLEQAGHSVIVQAWDFRPGSNFALEMQRAAAAANRTILVLSPNYLQSHFAQPEWAAAFAQDPEGQQRRVVPVRVAPCNVEGLLGQIVHIDLVGVPESHAASKLIAGIDPGRAKPTTPPAFPGSTSVASQKPVETVVPARQDLDWRALDLVPDVVWRTEIGRDYYYQSVPSRLEIHLIALSGPRFEARRLLSLPDELAALGRQSGLFTLTQELQSAATGDLAWVASARNGDADDIGILVTRDGQRGAWITLPYDGLGSVLDVTNTRPRLVTLMQFLLQLSVPLPSRFAFAVRVAPTSLLMIGNSALVGRRNSANLSLSTHDLTLLPEDSLPAEQLRYASEEVAEELLARLQGVINK